MKYVKMLGLAAVAAAALMAFAGASSASAAGMLCKEAPNASGTCASGQGYENATIHAVNVGVVKLTTSFKNIECSESTVQGTTEGETAKGPITTLTFSSCNCTVTVINNGSLEVNWTSGSNGTVTSKGAEVTASCSTIFGTVHCIYETGAGTNLGTATGGTEAQMDISENNIPRAATSSLCAEKANWDATYRVTSPTPLYIAKET